MASSSFRLSPNILLLLILTQTPSTPQNPTTHSDLTDKASVDCWHDEATVTNHSEVVRRILVSVRDTSVRIKDDNQLDYEQLDDLLIKLNDEVKRARADAKIASQHHQQGGDAEIQVSGRELPGLQLKFSEILTVTDDNLLIPVTKNVANLAPESTFVGLTAHGKHGEVKGRITGKSLEWHDGSTSYLRESTPGYFTLYFRTDRGQLHPGKNAITLRWSDIRNKIAYDLSDDKRREDFEREDKARREVDRKKRYY